MLSLVAGLVMIGVLVVIHEAGHFVVAKMFGIGTPVFSVGMGPRLFGVVWRGTDYRVSALPVGGYVRMAGADPFGEEDPDEIVDPDEDFMGRPVWQRLLVQLAGPAANLILPFVLFTAVLMLGEPQPGPEIGTILPGSAAAELGLREGDRVVRAGGIAVDTWTDFLYVLDDRVGHSVEVVVERDGAEHRVTLPADQMTLDKDGFIDSERLGLLSRVVSSRIGVDDATSPAGRAGLRTGDAIVAVDGVAVEAWGPLLQALEGGDRHEITWARDVDGERVDGTATLVADPTWSPRADDPCPQAHRWGLLPAQLFVGSVSEDRPAFEAGIKADDRLYRIDGQGVRVWADLVNLVTATVEEGGPDAQPRPLEVEVVRGGQLTTLTFSPKVEREIVGAGEVNYRPVIGIFLYHQSFVAGPRVKKYYSLTEAVPRAVEEGVAVFTGTINVLRNLVTGDLYVKESLGGPVAIFQAAGETAKRGIFAYARIMGTISFSLGIINLLPVPVLDGGHIFFYLVEGIRGRPLSLELRERVQMVGVLALVAVMLLVTVMDVSRWLED